MTSGRGLVAAGLVAVAVVSACGGDDQGETDAGPSPRPVLEVGVGPDPTCLLVEEEFPAEVEELPVVECAVAHSHEIYASVDYDLQDVYPGVEELDAFAQRECLKRFEPFVGISAFDSSLSFSWLLPSLAGWNDENDRAVLCSLSDAEGSQLTGTMRDSRR